MNKHIFFGIMCFFGMIALVACSLDLTSGLSQAEINGTAVSATLVSIVATSNALISTSAPALALPPTSEPGSNVPYSLGKLRLIFLDATNNLWVWNEDGGTVQLTFSNDVNQALISLDGSTVVYTRNMDSVHYSLWAVQTDGSNPRLLLGADFFNHLPTPENALAMIPLHLAWVPGTLNLLFNTGANFEMGSFPSDDLWMVNTSTATNRQLKEGGKGGNFNVSPDGKKVAIVKPTSLTILFLDGSFEITPLSFPAMITYSEGQYYPIPVWAADSTHLRIVIPPVDPLADQNAMTISIYDVPTDGDPAVLLKQVQVRPFSQFPISPDLQWLLYLTTDNPAENTVAVHLASLSGTQDVIELTARLDNLFWTPASNGFVVQISDPESSEVYGLQSTQNSDLTDTKRVESIQFIDNTRFFFIHDTGTFYELRMGTLGYPSSQRSVFIINLPRTTPSGFPPYSFTK